MIQLNKMKKTIFNIVKLSKGDLVTLNCLSDKVLLYVEPHDISTKIAKTVGSILKGQTALILDTNIDSTLVRVLGTNGMGCIGWTFGAYFNKVEKL